MTRRRVDALVIGAGAAGLAAAREISQAGRSVVVIEARERVGGRIFTVHDQGSPLPIELGAEFVHGQPEETFQIIRAAELPLDELPDQHYRSREGKLSLVPDFWKKLYEMRRDIGRSNHFRDSNGRGRDFSLAQYLERAHLNPEKREMLLNFAEGYHAAHPEKISARAIAAGDEEQESDNKQFRMSGGYDALTGWMRAGFHPERVELRLNTVATELHWKRGEVVLECVSRAGASLEPFRAKAAIVTLPLAVLKARALGIEPEIPEKMRAAEKLEAGQIFKIVLRFRCGFWNEEDFVKKHLQKRGSNSSEVNFVHAQDADIPVWWTASPSRAPILTGWAGGPKAEALFDQGEDMRIDRTLNALAHVFGIGRREVDENLESWSTHDWQSDPFSRAAYTYVGVGGISAPEALARPVQGTLFFAGEATDTEEMGTVAGAIGSGRRAAKQVIEAVR
jgi:monoamine oxidase